MLPYSRHVLERGASSLGTRLHYLRSYAFRNFDAGQLSLFAKTSQLCRQSVIRSIAARRASDLTVNPAWKEKRPAAVERPIPERPPPQADAPIQLRLGDTNPLSDPAVNHTLGSTSRQSHRHVRRERRQKPQHRHTLPITWVTHRKNGKARIARPTPSDRLLAALPSHVRHALSPLKCNKPDLSHVAVRQWENVPRAQRSREYLFAWKKGSKLLRSGQKHPTRDTPLSVILSQYIADRRISEDKALSKLREAQTAQSLECRGYRVNDVLIWSRILSYSDPDQVALEFVTMAQDLSASDHTRLPTFLLMFILRTKSLKAPGLRLLLNYIWKHYAGPVAKPTPSIVAKRISLQTAMVMVVRLIRHARIAWPSGLEDIAALATELIDREPGETLHLSRQRIHGLSHLYNRLLKILAHPTSLRPMLSVVIQQRAQFCLIRKMTTFEPHLPVTREGFRALTKVQLAHKKTDREKRWARSKALSWPPWKEELLGIKLDSEDFGKDSRALNVLSQMTKAGYSHGHWEQTSRILAGWDTDGSPTIQNRRLLVQEPVLRNKDVRLAAKPPNNHEHKIWAARILATRTVKEAWACFTCYEESTKHDAIEPYDAMFTKLLHVGKPSVNGAAEDLSVVPGDGKETWPEPTSPHDFLFVPSNPPSVDELFDRMTKKGLRPRKYLLADLLDHADTLIAGIRYLNASKLRGKEKDLLLGNTEKNVEGIRATSSSIPDQVMAAFVRLLCRAPAEHDKTFALPTFLSSDQALPRQTDTADPFFYAQNLVVAIQPSYRPTWYALFQGWNRRISPSQPYALSQQWASFLGLLHTMDRRGIDLDFEAFRDIGEILEQFLLTSRLPLADAAPGFFGERDTKLGCVSLCKGLINAMAYGGSVQSKHRIVHTIAWLPVDRSSTSEGQNRLIDIVTPAALHRTIRILGMGEDLPSIVTLLRWVHRFAAEFAQLSSELANSRKLIRHALTAARYFLEKSWRDHEFTHRAAARDEWQPGQQELLLEAKDILEQHVNDWGGWPTDEELFAYYYINTKKGKRLRMNAYFESRGQRARE